MNRKLVLLSVLITCSPGMVVAADPVPIKPAEIKHEGPVDFQKEILPILQKKCLACHNATDAESELVLETPQTILKGGSNGPSAVAGKSDESHLIRLASRQDEPIMPPEGNKVGAKPLTPEELALIKLWIDQGATGSVQTALGPIKWQPLPAGVNPIYAVSISPDGQWVAAARANQVFLYHVPTKREYGRLTDPAIIASGLYKNPGVAHVDLVQSLKFSPDSQLLVSGEYRTVKWWQRKRDSRKQELTGIESPIRALARSVDGKLVALGVESGQIHLFELASGSRLRTLEGQHSAAVASMCFSKDGSRLVSGSPDKFFVVWNVADGKVLGKHETPAPISAVVYLADDQQIATGGADNLVRSWTAFAAADAATKPATVVKEFAGHAGPITSLAVNPANAAQFLSGSQDGTVRIWDIASGNQVQQLAHGGPITQIAVRGDGQRIVSASQNHSAKLWNGGNFQQIAEIKGDFRTGIRTESLQRAVAVAKRHVEGANGDLKQATDRKAAEEKNVTGAEEAHKKAGEEFTKKAEAAKKPVEEKQAADKALEEAKLAVTRLETMKKTAETAVTSADTAIQKAKTELESAAKEATEADTSAKQAAEQLAKAKEAFEKAEKLAAAAIEKQKAILVAKAAKEKAATDAETARKNAEEAKKKAESDLVASQEAVKQAEKKANDLKDPAQKATDEKNTAERAVQSAMRGIERAKEAASKAAAALPGFEAAVKQFEAAQKQAEALVQSASTEAGSSEKPILCVAFSPDGLTFATAGEDQVVHTWDAETGAGVETFTGHGATVSLLSYTASGDVISVGTNNKVFVWDTNPAWELVRTLGSPDNGNVFVDRVTALDFSPDGKLLAAGGGEPSRSGQLKLFQVADGQLAREIPDAHSDVIYGLEFSPDGKQIATCGADRFAKVFDVESGKPVRSFEGHTHHVLGVSWRADGRLLATSGADNAVKVWDVRTGDQQRTIQGFSKEVTAIRFVAETDNIVASSGDASVQLTNTTNGRGVRGFAGSSDFMHSCGVSANGKLIVAGGQESIVRLWTTEGQEYAKFDAPK